MPTIRFSPVIIQNSLNSSNFGILTSAVNPSSAALIAGASVTGISLLIVYRGTKPTFPSFADRSTRAADVLITFSLPANPWNSFGTVNNADRYLIGKHPATQNASASGVATWFMLCRSGTTSLTDKGALIGDVGVTGSGADLEIPSTNIVLGNGYQSAGLYVNFPLNRIF